MKYALLIFTFPYLFNNCSCKQYRASLISLEACKDPELPYASPMPFQLILEVFNSSKGFSLLRGNLTAPRDLPAQNLRGTFAYGTETPTGIKWRATMKDLACNSFVAKAIVVSYGIPIKGCFLKKGVYVFKDIDVDAIDTAFLAAPVRTYGLYVTRGTIVSKKETLGCWVCHVKVSPLKKQ